jgi:hypothetical protein
MGNAIVLNKLEKYLYYLLLFSIPFQTRKILYFEGWRFNEWQSISIYATDLLFGVLLIYWLINDLRFKKSLDIKTYDFFLLIFLIASAVSIKNSSSQILGWFQWAKLLEFVIFFYYLRCYAINKFGLSNSFFAIFWSGLFQGVIAIGQFLNQSSLGLKYLGEGVLNLNIKGVANFYNFYGEKIMRAYGTTPHPNVIAAYFFLALFAFYFIWFYKRIKYDKLLLWGYFITLWAFFLTFARVAIFLLGANYIVRGALLFIKFKKLKSKRVWQIIGYTLVPMLLFAVFYWPEIVSRILISAEDEAVQLRNYYNQESLKNIEWIGTGMGDSVHELMIRSSMLPSYLYQPVHNIYLLILSEVGIIGLSAFILFLVFLGVEFIKRTRLARFHHYSLMLLSCSFLFMGIFDHFLWTLQQGRFLLWFVLAILSIDKNEDILYNK